MRRYAAAPPLPSPRDCFLLPSWPYRFLMPPKKNPKGVPEHSPGLHRKGATPGGRICLKPSPERAAQTPGMVGFCATLSGLSSAYISTRGRREARQPRAVFRSPSRASMRTCATFCALLFCCPDGTLPRKNAPDGKRKGCPEKTGSPFSAGIGSGGRRSRNSRHRPCCRSLCTAPPADTGTAGGCGRWRRPSHGWR